MANDSSSGGYLAPASINAPAQDLLLDLQLQAIVTGIVGIDGTLVRPRWQPISPKQPAREVDWCAIGVVSTTPDDTAFVTHRSVPTPADWFFGQTYLEDVGHDELQRHETLDITASFYGPNSTGNASLLRDGFSISQNREVMQSQGMGYIETVSVVAAPELINQAWVRRVDVTFRIRRIVLRTYPVLNILAAQGAIRSDQTDTPRDPFLPPSADTPFEVER